MQIISPENQEIINENDKISVVAQLSRTQGKFSKPNYSH